MIQFSDQQQKTIDSRGKNVVVSASAGSGKTSVLVERLSRLVIEDRISIDTILAMTFTEDAAAEMKARLKSRLSTQEPSPYVLDQLALLEQADISTIDSFCYKIVQTYYYKIPISYTMSQRVDNGTYQKQAFETAMRRAMADTDPVAMAKLRLYFHAFHSDDDVWMDAVRRFLAFANAKPDPVAWMRGCLKPNEALEPWFFQFFKERAEAMADMAEEMLETVRDMEFSRAKTQADNEELFASKARLLRRCLQDLDNMDYPAFRVHMIDAIENTKRFPKSVNKHSFKDIADEYKQMETEIVDHLFSLERFASDEARQAETAALFVELCVRVHANFQEEKKALEILDFNDMEHFAYALLQDPLIQEEVRNKYAVILVDEFQDTNELQESIIACIERGDNVFRVGDMKQSIYGFRQAKPSIMLGHMKKQDERNETLILGENYRSSASIVAFNNDFYERIMNTSFLTPQFFAEDVAKVGTDRQKQIAQHPVRFLFTQYEDWAIDQGVSKIEAKKTHRLHRADLIANDILKHHAKGIPFRSMCVLTRTHGTHEFLKESLEAYGIPVLAEINHGFYTNHAVQIVMACLEAMLDPDQDIALTGALCSPLCGVSQSQIAAYGASRDPDASLYSVIKDKSFMGAFHELQTLLGLPVPALLRHVYNRNQFYYQYTNAQDKTNLDLLLEKAVQFRDPRNLAAFLAEIREEADLDRTSEAYPYGKEEDVVKIKTMHHSKGLQFPIVYILSQQESRDMDASSPMLFDEQLGIAMRSLSENGRLSRPSRATIAFKTKKFHDELAEEMRVLYVATTRAEQELVIVDAIKSLDMYRYPLNARALLQKRSYTSWLLHTYLNEPSALFVLDEVKELYTRQAVKKKKRYKPAFHYYEGPREKIESQTASRAKQERRWKPVSLKENTRTVRGTLLHAVVATLPYPYEQEAMERLAKERGETLSPLDVEQILALNENADYARWMACRHEFECAYSVMEQGRITHGFMDLVVFAETETIIVDFKSDYVASANELKKQYAPQLGVYKHAMRLIDADRPVRTFIYSFYLKNMCELCE